MGKTYIFAIGNTGARVMRSLTMLMAAGTLQDRDITPVFVTLDSRSGDSDRACRLLYDYSKLQNSLSMYSVERMALFNCCPLALLPADASSGRAFTNIFLHGWPSLDYHARLVADSQFDRWEERSFDKSPVLVSGSLVDSIEMREFLRVIGPNDRAVVVASSCSLDDTSIAATLLRVMSQHPFPMSLAAFFLDPYLYSPINRVSPQDMADEFRYYYSKSGLCSIPSRTCFVKTPEAGSCLGLPQGGERQALPAQFTELFAAMAVAECCMDRLDFLPLGESEITVPRTMDVNGMPGAPFPVQPYVTGLCALAVMIKYCEGNRLEEFARRNRLLRETYEKVMKEEVLPLLAAFRDWYKEIEQGPQKLELVDIDEPDFRYFVKGRAASRRIFPGLPPKFTFTDGVWQYITSTALSEIRNWWNNQGGLNNRADEKEMNTIVLGAVCGACSLAAEKILAEPENYRKS